MPSSELSDITIVEGASTQSGDAVEIIRDPAGRLRKWLVLGAAAVGLYLIVVVLAGVIFDGGSQNSIPPTTTDTAGPDEPTPTSIPATADSGVPRLLVGIGSDRERVELPDRVDILPDDLFSDVTLIGHNERRQLVIIDLGSGTVTEPRPADGFQFITQSSSPSQATGFFTYDGTMIAFAANGSHRVLPVTQTDAPFLYPTETGVWIHAVRTGALHRSNDDGSVDTFEPLPADVVVVGSTADRLLLGTPDGTTFVFDPEAGTTVGEVPGRVLAAGHNRYVSVHCPDVTSCQVVAATFDGADVVTLKIDPASAEASIHSLSPSGQFLAIRAGRGFDVVDLLNRNTLASFDTGGESAAFWAGSDTFVMVGASSETGPNLWLYRAGSGVRALTIDPLLLDTSSGLMALSPTS